MNRGHRATISALSGGNNVCSLKKQQCLLKKQQCLLSQEATMSALSRMEPRTKGLSQGRARGGGGGVGGARAPLAQALVLGSILERADIVAS